MLFRSLSTGWRLLKGELYTGRKLAQHFLQLLQEKNQEWSHHTGGSHQVALDPTATRVCFEIHEDVGNDEDTSSEADSNNSSEAGSNHSSEDVATDGKNDVQSKKHRTEEKLEDEITPVQRYELSQHLPPDFRRLRPMNLSTFGWQAMFPSRADMSPLWGQIGRAHV